MTQPQTPGHHTPNEEQARYIAHLRQFHADGRDLIKEAADCGMRQGLTAEYARADRARALEAIDNAIMLAVRACTGARDLPPPRTRESD